MISSFVARGFQPRDAALKGPRYIDARKAMEQISIGEARYRILATERNGHWVARAERADTGTPFGIECDGPTATNVVERLAGWLHWQSAHAAALDALQRAERAYHRTIADNAFTNPDGRRTAAEKQRESLNVVAGARVRLDEIRARQPE